MHPYGAEAVDVINKAELGASIVADGQAQE